MSVHLGIPQIIFAALSVVSLLLHARDHGKPRSKENFWIALLGACLSYSLLIWGGFFR